MNGVDNVNVVELVSVDNSRITRVSLYAGRAEITRCFTVSLQAGQNRVLITRLPDDMDQRSLRVEGRGKATIHDVSVSRMSRVERRDATPLVPLTALNREKKRTKNAIARCTKALAAVEGYVGSLSIDKLDISQLGNAAEAYDSAAEKLNDKVIELEAKLEELETEIDAEEVRLKDSSEGDTLRLKASVGVFAESEGQVELVLIYAVNAATWSAAYDIRVDTQVEDRSVTLVYKASISQSTGESWEDASLILETAMPTFENNIPVLDPWNIYYGPSEASFGKRRHRLRERYPAGRKRPRFLDVEAEVESEEDEDLEDALEDSFIVKRASLASSKGHVNATFSVPGCITIPCDGVAHSVTVAQLELDASLIWLAVPKADKRVHLKAKINNSSEYHLLRGNSSMFVDGSFVSQSYIGPVSPHEKFECSLGLDPSIRVAYAPLSKVVSQRGPLFSAKTTVYTCSQRTTIHNTKSVAIAPQRLHILDNIPVSLNAQTTVKVISPALNPSAAAQESPSIPPPVHVGEGVLAQWSGADEAGADAASLGKDGKFIWLCGMPAHGKLSLNLHWEVSAPIDGGWQVQGL